MNPTIADVYLRPARSFSVITAPGRRLHFLNGVGSITNDADLEYVLSMTDASVRPIERYREHAAQRIAARGEMNSSRCEIDCGDRVLPAGEYPAHLNGIIAERNALSGFETMLAEESITIDDLEPTDAGWSAPKRARKET